MFKYAVSEMANVAEKIMKRNDLEDGKIDYLIPHQANKRIIDATANRLDLSEDKVLMNIDRYGNTTAATLPLLLYDYESKFKKGDKLVFSLPLAVDLLGVPRTSLGRIKKPIEN